MTTSREPDRSSAGPPAPDTPALGTPAPGRPVRGSTSGRPVMAALDLLGRRWVLRVIWELHRAGAPIGFRDLQRRCDNMSSSVLSTRLAELREAGITASTAHSTWHLTPLGDELVSSMGPLLDWSRTWAERQ
ncbi:winged helix-turn-helix transcriptional regulator [Streptomyces sp. NPDC005808]|uniref:winged helix-turn-helix transcriptional regulator n=1 Tax=Streptomyces sp. NPDC005808 TaxID=3364734 RepID=UPI0036A20D80